MFEKTVSRLPGSILLLLFGLFFHAPAFAAVPDNPCDPAHTFINAESNAVISPSGDVTGVTDTLNLQCFADTVAAGGPIDWIKLGPGEFYLKHVNMTCPRGKICTLSGNTRDTTVVNFPAEAIDCQAFEDQGLRTRAIRFIRSWQVKNTTFDVSTQCGEGKRLHTTLLFTGPIFPDGLSCPDTVIDSSVNNVLIRMPQFTAIFGILTAPTANTCEDRLLGSFRTNKVEVTGPSVGVSVVMNAGARDSHDFLKTRGTTYGYYKGNSSQVTMINFCDIEAKTNPAGSAFGITVDRADIMGVAAPQFDKTYVSNCTFHIDGTAGGNPTGILVDNLSPSANYDFVFTRNRFNMKGQGAWGLYIRNFSGGIFKGNTFTGEGGLGVVVLSDGLPATNWVFTELKGLNSFNRGRDILFVENTSDNVVGPVPNIIVDDGGCNFDLNKAGGGCALAGDAEN